MAMRVDSSPPTIMATIMPPAKISGASERPAESRIFPVSRMVLLENSLPRGSSGFFISAIGNKLSLSPHQDMSNLGLADSTIERNMNCRIMMKPIRTRSTTGPE
ncbi:MAG TPA: hypothetical protein PLO51_01865, partial [Candidatus Micrarchaeota archaeon]|nr:hypothetical protein [Candidatus Micrarchaeota archaeon]